MSTHEPEPGGYPIPPSLQLPRDQRSALPPEPSAAAGDALARAIAYRERLEVRERAVRARETALDARERETSGGETLDELTGRLIWRESELAAGEARAEAEARTLLAWQHDLKTQQAGLRSWQRGLWAWSVLVVGLAFWVLVTCAGTLPAGGRP